MLKSIINRTAVLLAAVICSTAAYAGDAADSEAATVAYGGTVTDFCSRAVAGADVTLAGDRTYTTVTGDDGTFSFAEVEVPATYRITINKLMLEPYTATVTLTDTRLPGLEVTLEPYLGKPALVKHDATEAGELVSWLMPIGRQQMKFDNGRYSGMYLQQGQHIEYVRYGVCFTQPQVVEQVLWSVCELVDGKVDVAVFLRDARGDISKTPVFEQRDVPSATYEWTGVVDWQSYTLPTPIEAPYGCVVSVGHSSAEPMRICTDYTMPWDYGNSVVSANDCSDGWGYAMGGNFLIRTNATVLSRDLAVEQVKAAQLRSAGLAPAPAPAPTVLEGISFNVWRLKADDLGDNSRWTELQGTTDGLYLIDRDMATLPQGCYYYAVQAQDYSGRLSEIAYSEEIAHKMTTDVTIKVFTNTALDNSAGALVTLTKMNDRTVQYQAVVANNVARFTAIPKDYYNIDITKEGFKPAHYEEMNWKSEPDYQFGADLQLDPQAPFGLRAEQAGDSQEVLLTWNENQGIFDDFDSMPDFEINPAGDYGWEYVDADGGDTFGAAMCQNSPYPGMWQPMAFQVMNPYATTPQLTAFVQPFSGQKVLVSAGLQAGGRNDDYLFSPELNYSEPFTLQFMAASGFLGVLGLEEFMVGYCTGAAAVDDVVWLTEEPVAASGVWQQYTYTLPAAARHAVIRCVSDQCMFFMLDDIFIGKREADIFRMTNFNVYLDEEPVGNTIARSFALGKLDEGKHLAKVQTVYPMVDGSNSLSPFTELLFTVAEYSEAEDASVASVEAQQLYSYDPATAKVTAGDATVAMTLYDLTGRQVTAGREFSTTALSGLYLLRLTTASGHTVTRKLML